MKQAFDAHPGPLLFDFSRLDHIDSSIVTLLVQGLRLAGPRGVSVVAADRNTLNLLDRMGFNSLASIFPSMQAFEESRTLLT
jgi:anti-anti-sigma regulatory factor